MIQIKIKVWFLCERLLHACCLPGFIEFLSSKSTKYWSKSTSYWSKSTSYWSKSNSYWSKSNSYWSILTFDQNWPVIDWNQTAIDRNQSVFDQNRPVVVQEQCLHFDQICSTKNFRSKKCWSKMFYLKMFDKLLQMFPPTRIRAWMVCLILGLKRNLNQFMIRFSQIKKLQSYCYTIFPKKSTLALLDLRFNT